MPISPRELQMLELLAEGNPYSRIAEILGVSYKTVVNTCSQLKAKLNARNLPDLIRIAVQLVFCGLKNHIAKTSRSDLEEVTETPRPVR